MRGRCGKQDASSEVTAAHCLCLSPAPWAASPTARLPRLRPLQDAAGLSPPLRAGARLTLPCAPTLKAAPGVHRGPGSPVLAGSFPRPLAPAVLVFQVGYFLACETAEPTGNRAPRPSRSVSGFRHLDVALLKHVVPVVVSLFWGTTDRTPRRRTRVSWGPALLQGRVSTGRRRHVRMGTPRAAPGPPLATSGWGTRDGNSYMVFRKRRGPKEDLRPWALGFVLLQSRGPCARTGREVRAEVTGGFVDTFGPTGLVHPPPTHTHSSPLRCPWEGEGEEEGDPTRTGSDLGGGGGCPPRS